MDQKRDDLTIVALDFAWRTANQRAQTGDKYTKEEVLHIAREYLAFLRGGEKAAA